MKIIYKTGDLLKADEKYIAHGCNAKGVMGSGVAKAIRVEYPGAYETYREVYELNGNKLELGMLIAYGSLVHTIFNCITQDTYGRDKNVRYVDYDAVRHCMKRINNRFLVDLWNDFPPTAVAMPKIGCNLGNGDWSIIEKIIEEESTAFQPVVYLYDADQPDFAYYECGVCGFDSIQKSDWSGSDVCPLCEGDSGQINWMASRVSRVSDKPEGKDARNE